MTMSWWSDRYCTISWSCYNTECWLGNVTLAQGNNSELVFYRRWKFKAGALRDLFWTTKHNNVTIKTRSATKGGFVAQIFRWFGSDQENQLKSVNPMDFCQNLLLFHHKTHSTMSKMVINGCRRLYGLKGDVWGCICRDIADIFKNRYFF